MKKAIYMAVVFLIIAFGGSAYMNYLASGKLVLPFAQFFEGKSAGQMLEGMKDKATNVGKEASAKVTGKDTSPKVYKWQDKNGQWHYSSTAPQNSQKAQQVTIKKNQNVIDSVKVELPAEPEQAQTTAKPVIKKPNPYSPSQVKETIDAAKNMQKMVDERAAQQKAVLDSLK